jgi:large subunit ribosomal protein L32
LPPLPKKKHSRKRKGGRSAHHGIRPFALSECPQCGAARLPHRLCKACGYYNGRAVLPVESTTGE